MINKRIESLTDEELAEFNNVVAYYGGIMDAALVCGLHHQTLRLIKKVGYGKPGTIAIIRKKLLNRHKATITA